MSSGGVCNHQAAAVASSSRDIIGMKTLLGSNPTHPRGGGGAAAASRADLNAAANGTTCENIDRQTNTVVHPDQPVYRNAQVRKPIQITLFTTQHA